MSCHSEAGPPTAFRDRVHINLQGQTGLYFLEVILLAIPDELLVKISQCILHIEIYLRQDNFYTYRIFYLILIFPKIKPQLKLSVSPIKMIYS